MRSSPTTPVVSVTWRAGAMIIEYGDGSWIRHDGTKDEAARLARHLLGAASRRVDTRDGTSWSVLAIKEGA